MKKLSFVHNLWWTSPTVRFDPKNLLCMSHQDKGTDMTDVGWIKIGEAEVTYTIFDNVDPTSSQLQAIDREITRIEVEAANKINQFRQLKANLLALPGPGGDN